MKIICSDKIINLDKFESVQYRVSLWGDSYPVEAIRHETSGGLFGGVGTTSEEIARFKHPAVAKALVKAITDSWIANEQVFDVEKWEVDKTPYYTPTQKPTPLSKEIKKLNKAISSSLEHLQNQEKTLNNDFYKFCTQHSCREDCRNQDDYCPIADKVRDQYGGISGGKKCETVFKQQISHPHRPGKRQRRVKKRGQKE